MKEAEAAKLVTDLIRAVHKLNKYWRTPTPYAAVVKRRGAEIIKLLTTEK